MINSLFLRELLLQARERVESLITIALLESSTVAREGAISHLLHLQARSGMSPEGFLLDLNKWIQDLEKQRSGSTLTFHVSSVPLVFGEK
jgi:hypothetical protein